MSKNITVRQAVLADLEALAHLFDQYRQFYRKTSDVAAARRFLAARFEHGESVLFIAHEDNEPVGFTQLYPGFSSLSLARIFLLNDLFVHEQARRKGVGEWLLAAAAEFARNLGAHHLTLSTARANLTAQALYSSTGWKRDDEFLVYSLNTTG